MAELWTDNQADYQIDSIAYGIIQPAIIAQKDAQIADYKSQIAMNTKEVMIRKKRTRQEIQHGNIQALDRVIPPNIPWEARQADSLAKKLISWETGDDDDGDVETMYAHTHRNIINRDVRAKRQRADTMLNQLGNAAGLAYNKIHRVGEIAKRKVGAGRWTNI